MNGIGGNGLAINVSAGDFFLQHVLGASQVVTEAVKTYSNVDAANVVFETEISFSDEVETFPTGFDFSTFPVTFGPEIPSGSQCAQSGGCQVLDMNFFAPDNAVGGVVQEGDVIPGGFFCVVSCDIRRPVVSSPLLAETTSLMDNAENIETNIFGAFIRDDRFNLVPGIELQGSEDISFTDEIDFGAGLGSTAAPSLWRFNELAPTGDVTVYSQGQAGVFTVRATGDLIFENNITDGFVNGNLSDQTSGWDFNFIAGADFSGAGLFSTTGDANILLQENTIVRTSTGSISFASSGDLIMEEKSVIYTSGYDTGTGVFDEPETINIFDSRYITGALFPVGGGDIAISVGGDVVGGSQQITSDWLQRIGNGDTTRTLEDSQSGTIPTLWAVVPEDFEQNIAALGGGDISISAGGDLVGLAVSIPTTGKPVGEVQTNEFVNGINDITFYDTELVVQGGGDLTINSGGNILSGYFFLGDGEAKINAGGNIVANESGQSTVLVLNEGGYDVVAGGDITIGTVVNSTMLRQSGLQSGSSTAVLNLNDPEVASFFFTYDEDNFVDLTSIGGDVVFENEYILPPDPLLLDDDPLNDANIINFGSNSILGVYPANVDATSLQGSVFFANDFSLFPSAQGGMNIFAENTISSLDNALAATTTINISDANPLLLPGTLNPTSTSEDVNSRFALINLTNPDPAQISQIHALNSVHRGQDTQVRFIANVGNIDDLRIFSPTETVISAGRNIEDIILEIQHADVSDISLVQSAEDIQFTILRNENTNELTLESQTGISIGGPGRLDVFAGGDIDLGSSRGIQSVGSSFNPNLNRQNFGFEFGADLFVISGLNINENGLQLSTFIETYLTDFEVPRNFETTGELVAFVQNLELSDREQQLEFIDLVSDFTTLDYLSGQRFNELSDAEINEIINGEEGVKADYSILPVFIQQQIAFRFLDERQDNYAADVIQFVTTDRYGGDLVNGDGEPITLNELLQMPIAEQFDIALANFLAADEMVQRELVLNTYVNEVELGGIQDVSKEIEDPLIDGFERSYAAIEALFPGSRPEVTELSDGSLVVVPSEQFGDINMTFSTIQTQQGGDVNLFAPGGGIDVGVAAVSGGRSNDDDEREVSQLGIITLRAGDVNAIVAQNVNVNSSRVFALDGGDIVLWSNEGNIDAGRGAKTALSVPPPIILPDGTEDFRAAVAGSGIRNSRFTQNRAPGSVLLFAPQGVIDAGDAGIASQGNVLIAAQEVIGADNIDVGGISIGVPVSTGVSASLAAASQAATTATSEATGSVGEDITDEEDERGAAFLTVEVIGLGF